MPTPGMTAPSMQAASTSRRRSTTSTTCRTSGTPTRRLADALARSRRLRGDDVFFLTGTDEHGQKVERAAQKAGLDTRVVRDRMARSFATLWSARHHARRLHPHDRAAAHPRGAGDLAPGARPRATSTWAPTRAGTAAYEAFVPETQLVDGRVSDHAATRSERSGGELLLPAVEVPASRCSSTSRRIPDFIAARDPPQRGAARSSKAGLEDLSASAAPSFKWGIPVPDDPAHVIYVWIDALTNYIDGARLRHGRRGAVRRVLAGRPAPHRQGHPRFHAVYWPAFLMARGLPLPKQVFGHGWWLRNGSKMSKSLGNVVDPQAASTGSASTRCATSCCARWSFGRTANFTDERFVDALQRRPRQRPRQPRQPRDHDGPSGTAAASCRRPAGARTG